MRKGTTLTPLHTASDSSANTGFIYSDDGLISPILASKPSPYPHHRASEQPLLLDANGWSASMQIALFHAIAKYRPLGAHKHFRMINIHRFFNSNSPVPMSISKLWEHLDILYDLSALDERTEERDDDEIEPITRTPSTSATTSTTQSVPRKTPSDTIFQFAADFTLPLDEYEELMNETRRTIEEEEATNSATTSSVSIPMGPPSAVIKSEMPAAIGRGRKRKPTAGKNRDEEKTEEVASSRATSPMTELSTRSSPESEEEVHERPWKRKAATNKKAARSTKPSSSNTSPNAAASVPETTSPNRTISPIEQESGSTRRSTRSSAAAAREAAAHINTPTPAASAVSRRGRKGRGV